ncbi:MAG: metallophosphoesterase [Kiritimatiellia bacterium]|nr:metallophosphoesterase [Kiritimatiellia bacterium]
MRSIQDIRQATTSKCTYRDKAWKRTRFMMSALIVVLVLALPVGLLAIDSSHVPAAQTGIVIAVTGDIYDPIRAKAVSDVILANKSLAAVLLVGDTCNTTPTPLEKYETILRGTYGRFFSIIYPCPGNHDKQSTPPFSAYCTFWGTAAHAPLMYYSFDLGDWHFISIDSVTFRKGGLAAEAQLTWLKADLASNPGKPTVAYWHYPLFSRAKHCGSPRMKPLWEAIYAHGPALIFNGHNHVYERFAPLDPDGNPVPETKGIQEFLIGPGGAAPVKCESTNALPPASAVFHGNAQHVGFFTLSADGGFRFTINSVTRDGTTAVVDSGSGKLLMKK